MFVLPEMVHGRQKIALHKMTVLLEAAFEFLHQRLGRFQVDAEILCQNFVTVPVLFRKFISFVD